jgi:hypothetical protein
VIFTTGDEVHLERYVEMLSTTPKPPRDLTVVFVNRFSLTARQFLETHAFLHRVNRFEQLGLPAWILDSDLATLELRNAFNDVLKIILEKNPQVIYDVGANTGKFELAVFSKNYKGAIVLCYLPKQLNAAKENLSAAGYEKNCIFYPIDVLQHNSEFKKAALPPDAILMSQFLDCFSKEEIISILKKAAAIMTPQTRLYILEPFWDEQKFDAAKLSLTHTSLYFTAIANANSKMYASAEMLECALKAGLKTVKIHKNIGSHEYSLLELKI